MEAPLFEAFFWIEPVRAQIDAPFTSTRVVWHYPQEVRHITQAFRNIPLFCFPDLEKVQLERPEANRSEFFTFTLTEGGGSRVYGVCMRPFFRGESLRYEAKRRTRHCLCFITRRPLFTLLRTVLLQVHGMTMLDAVRPGSSALQFLTALFAATPNNAAQLVVGRTQVPVLQRDFLLQLPRGRGSLAASDAAASAPLLPLLEALGVEKFLLLLGSVLCERRILFVADGIEKLSAAVLATASMLLPFSWQHIFIPMLPSALRDYVAAPMPFIIGVRRYLFSQLDRASLEGCVVVDVDAGMLRPVGRVQLRDLVGESASKARQASEAVDGMVKAGAGLVNMLMGRASGDASSDGPRDVMAVIVQDLSRAASARPGNSDTLRGVASGLVKSLAGSVGAVSSKAPDETKLEWQQDYERIARESLLLFYLYLFGDVETHAARPQARAGNGNTSGNRDRSASFDLNGFLGRRSQMGDSRELLDFLSEFRHSQMFERFCESRATRRAQEGPGSGGVPAGDEDVFDSLAREQRQRFGQSPTIAATKSCISGRSQRLAADQGHAPSVSYVDGGQTVAAVADRCVADASSDLLPKMLRLVGTRLEACRAAAGRGQAGAAGLRALNLLRILLLSGAQAVLSGSLDLLPLLRALVRPAMGPPRASALGNALQVVTGGGGQQHTDVRAAANAVLLLLLDHQRLQHQRLYTVLVREGRIAHLRATLQKIKYPALTSFATLHQACRPPPAVVGGTWASAELALTQPRLAVDEGESVRGGGHGGGGGGGARTPRLQTQAPARTVSQKSAAGSFDDFSPTVSSSSSYTALPDADFAPTQPSTVQRAPPAQFTEAAPATNPVPALFPSAAPVSSATADWPAPALQSASFFAAEPVQASAQDAAAFAPSVSVSVKATAANPTPVAALAPTPTADVFAAPFSSTPAPVLSPTVSSTAAAAEVPAPPPASPPKRGIQWVTLPTGELSPAKGASTDSPFSSSPELLQGGRGPLLRGFGPPPSAGPVAAPTAAATPSNGAVLLRGFGPAQPKIIPAEFRVVNRDTGEVTDLRDLQAPAASTLQAHTQAPTLPQVPVARPSAATVEQRMVAIYQKFNPAKVGEVPSLLLKYRGREMEMLARLEAKYASVPVFVNGVQLHPATLDSAPTTLLQQLGTMSMSVPAVPVLTPGPPQPPALQVLSAARAGPHSAPNSAWRPGMQSTGQNPGRQSSDPFADLVHLK